MEDAETTSFTRGVSALRAGNPEGAIDAFQRVIDSAPGLAEAYVNLGTAYLMLDNAAAAREAYEAAVARAPGMAVAQVQLGVLYRQAGAFDKAEAAYQAALDAEPDNRFAHLNLGILYDVYLRRPAQALPHYERFQALSAEPDDEVALWIADLKQRL